MLMGRKPIPQGGQYRYFLHKYEHYIQPVTNHLHVMVRVKNEDEFMRIHQEITMEKLIPVFEE